MSVFLNFVIDEFHISNMVNFSADLMKTTPKINFLQVFLKTNQYSLN